MKKQIVSETKNYEPSTVDELLLDDTPKVNSFNFVTSDGIARAIAGASGEVPVVTENDNGKILTAIYDEGGPAVEWGAVPSELPAVAGNAGKILAVNSGATGTEWVAKPSSTVSTDGVMSGDGSVADPVVLNYGSTLSTSSTSGVSSVLTMNNQTWTSGENYLILDWTAQPGASDVQSILSGNTPLYLNIAFPNGVTIQTRGGFQAPCYMFIYPDQSSEPVGIYKYLGESDANGVIELDLSALDLSTFTGYNYFKAPYVHNSRWVINFSPEPNDNQAIYTVLTGASPATSNVTFGEMVVGSTNLEVANPVPTPGSSDTNKVLTVTNSSGAFGWAAAPTELPSVTGNAGKVLTVNSGATGVEWTNFTQIEVVASLPASPTSGVLYIVTGA